MSMQMISAMGEKSVSSKGGGWAAIASIIYVDGRSAYI